MSSTAEEGRALGACLAWLSCCGPACPGSIATVVGVGTLNDLCSGCCRYTATPLAQQVLKDKEYEAKVGSSLVRCD